MFPTYYYHWIVLTVSVIHIKHFLVYANFLKDDVHFLYMKKYERYYIRQYSTKNLHSFSVFVVIVAGVLMPSTNDCVVCSTTCSNADAARSLFSVFILALVSVFLKIYVPAFTTSYKKSALHIQNYPFTTGASADGGYLQVRLTVIIQTNMYYIQTFKVKNTYDMQYKWYMIKFIKYASTSIFKIFILTHSLIKHIQCIKRQYIIHSKTHTKKLKTLIQGLNYHR